MRIIVLNFLLCALLAPNLSAQSDPVTEIQGRLSLYHPEDTTSVHIGLDAGKSQAVNYERGNTFIGSSAGSTNTVGSFNTFLGWMAGQSNKTTGDNTFIGTSAGLTNLGGDNTFVGVGAGRNDSLGNNSVAVGYRAGFSGGDRSVFLGYRAGEGGSDLTRTLYISNREGDDPLIYGEFDNKKIGINTSSPEMTFHIGGNGNESRLLLANAGDIFFKNSAGANKAILTLHSDDDTYLDAFDDLKLRSGHNLSQSDPDMILQADGDVGIGISDPTYKLHVDGAVRGTDIICSSTSLCSDVRFKKDFSDIPNPLDLITQLSGYYHHWRTDEFPKWQFSEGREIGFKAQEVREILPEIVEEMPDGYLAVDYSKVVPILVEAIKDLQALVEQQRHDHQVLLEQLQEIKKEGQ